MGSSSRLASSGRAAICVSRAVISWALETPSSLSTLMAVLVPSLRMPQRSSSGVISLRPSWRACSVASSRVERKVSV